MISVFQYAFSRSGPKVTVPWLARMIVLQSLTKGMMVSANFCVPGVSYIGDRHLAEEDLDLGQDALGDRLVGHGEGGGVRRMAVDDGIDVGPCL